tara:strand:- start:2261 stop:4222 length:1962 start_codon:yes stop_codon:yes gene_type:complete
VKKLEFKLKTAVGPFIPYKNFYWHRRWPQLVSMSFSDYFSNDKTSVTLAGNAILTQSVALFASQIAYNTLKTGVDTPYPVRVNSSRNYSNAFTTASSPATSNLFQEDDYIEHSAIYNENNLPDSIFIGSNHDPEHIHSFDLTASFASFKRGGYSLRTKRAWNNAESEIQRFYKGEDLKDYAIIKSNKKEHCPNCKFRIKRSLRDSDTALRDITLCVSIANDYMPTTNLDMMGPFPWIWSLPYGGLGNHTTEVYSSPGGIFNTSSFEVEKFASKRMTRTELNVPDERRFKFTYNLVSDAIEELSFEEFFASSSLVTTVQSLVDAGHDPGGHPMPFKKYFDYGIDKDGYPYLGLKSENITALIDPDHASAETVTALNGLFDDNVPSVAPISPYVPEFNNNTGIWLRIFDCQDGNISGAELFGLEGRKRVGGMKDDVYLEEAILAIPLIEDEKNTAEPLKVSRETVLSRIKYLQKDGKLRFKYFDDDELKGVTLNRDADKAESPNPVDDYILASEKYVFPPEFDIARLLEDKTWTPFFGVTFEFSKKISTCERLSLWQGVLTDGVSTSETVEQTISVPVDLFGPNFKFKDKTIRVMLIKVKKRAETNYKVWRSKLLNLEYDSAEDYRQSYNYPYDEFTILPLSELVAKVYCKEDSE